MKVIDERFLRHRLQSTSTAGIAGGVLAGLLFLYRYHFDHRLEWDLFAVLAAIAAIKVALMIYYRLTD
jgi:sugar phosphate permease